MKFSYNRKILKINPLNFLKFHSRIRFNMRLSHTITMNKEIITTSIRDEKEFNTWIIVTHPSHPTYDTYMIHFLYVFVHLSIHPSFY